MHIAMAAAGEAGGLHDRFFTHHSNQTTTGFEQFEQFEQYIFSKFGLIGKFIYRVENIEFF
jgi:hypothetical protein